MAGNNMPLDDLLADLGRWGYVDLSFKWGQWHCEVRVPGYTVPAPLMSYQKASAATPTAACEAVFDKLEEWRASGVMQQDRDRYLDSHNFYVERYEKASAHQRMGFDPIRHPGKCEPERPLPRSA